MLPLSSSCIGLEAFPRSSLPLPTSLSSSISAKPGSDGEALRSCYSAHILLRPSPFFASDVKHPLLLLHLISHTSLQRLPDVTTKSLRHHTCPRSSQKVAFGNTTTFNIKYPHALNEWVDIREAAHKDMLRLVQTNKPHDMRQSSTNLPT